ncbi:MAG: hypothetical protein HKN51_06010, partial [Saprospiraceae bacterium]|nr:hypothetical protein [Saprospiraceae bacterium]
PLNRQNTLECYIHVPHKISALQDIFVDDVKMQLEIKDHSEFNRKDKIHGDLIYFKIPISENATVKYSKMEFAVTEIVIPHEKDPNNPDKLPKSIALDWIYIRPVE